MDSMFFLFTLHCLFFADTERVRKRDYWKDAFLTDMRDLVVINI